MTRRPPTSTLFPYTTLFRSARRRAVAAHDRRGRGAPGAGGGTGGDGLRPRAGLPLLPPGVGRRDHADDPAGPLRAGGWPARASAGDGGVVRGAAVGDALRVALLDGEPLGVRGGHAGYARSSNGCRVHAVRLVRRLANGPPGHALIGSGLRSAPPRSSSNWPSPRPSGVRCRTLDWRPY